MLLLMYYFFIVDRVGLIIFNCAIIVGIIVFSAIINKVRPERETHLVIQVAFAFVLIISIIFFTTTTLRGDGENSNSEKASIPVVFEDYKEYDVIEDTSYNGNANFLGSVDTYFVFG